MKFLWWYFGHEKRNINKRHQISIFDFLFIYIFIFALIIIVTVYWQDEEGEQRGRWDQGNFHKPGFEQAAVHSGIALYVCELSTKLWVIVWFVPNPVNQTQIHHVCHIPKLLWNALMRWISLVTWRLGAVSQNIFTSGSPLCVSKSWWFRLLILSCLWCCLPECGSSLFWLCYFQ